MFRKGALPIVVLSAICGVKMFTALFKGIEYSSIFLAFVFIVAMVCLIFFFYIAINYENEGT